MECKLSLIQSTDTNYYTSHLSGVMVSVLATGPKGSGLKPGLGEGFLILWMGWGPMS
jgi:hypothetical protein